MSLTFSISTRILLLFLIVEATILAPTARASSCKTQAQITAAERNALSIAARAMVDEIQSGDVQALQANTISAVASDFSGIAASVASLKPLLQRATITVDSIYALDNSTDPIGISRTDFYCGMPVVTLNFSDLLPGSYAFVIVHSTGVPQAQQISFVLSETSGHQWMLGGLFSKPMMEAGHDGMWYWMAARIYAQKNMKWNAWFNYRVAASLLNPVEFLSSPNLERLQQEADQMRPDNLPGTKPLSLTAQGSVFQVTTIDTTSEFGALDLEIHYTAEVVQTAQLRDPPTARAQVVELMTALLALHPELHTAFHGFWVKADLGSVSVFALELPMDQIVLGAPSLAQVQPTVPIIRHNPTDPELQPHLEADQDPIPSPDAEDNAFASKPPLISPPGLGEIQKRQDGVYTMHQDVDEVLLTCAVVDEKGRLITDLGRDDFRISEDGVPQATSSFLHQDQPVSLGILVDNSGSMLDKRAAVNAAALNLLEASNPQDAAFIVNFSDRAFLDQGFTSDIKALNRGLSHFDSKGTTALYDAVAVSAGELANHGKFPKQVLLVITDGADNASHLDLEQAIRRVQNLGGPVVYTIGLLFGADKEEAEQARIALERLSQETGGIAYFPHSLQDVDGIAAKVAHDIRDQYTIGYHSTKPANLGGYRVVRVEANAPKHGALIVRTRKGYYAKKMDQQQPRPALQAKQ
jgi:VWFA-related protein